MRKLRKLGCGWVGAASGVCVGLRRGVWGAGGVAAWQKAGLPVMKTAQISPQELTQKLREGSLCAADVLDVRREGEWQAGHIAQVQCRPPDTFPQALPAMDGSRPVAVHCKSGYRSMIAC